MAVDVTMLDAADRHLSPRGSNGVAHPIAAPCRDDLDQVARQTSLCLASQAHAKRRSRYSRWAAVLATILAGMTAAAVFWWLGHAGP